VIKDLRGSKKSKGKKLKLNSKERSRKMKKATAFLVSLLFFAGITAFAQAKKSTPIIKAAEMKTFKGKIESITLGDPAKNKKTEIAVKSEDQKSLTVTVKANTRFLDTEDKAMTVDKLKVGDKVHITYTTTAAGIHNAKSIKLMK
jgi:uncharacterized lipoprotein YajG